MDSRFRSLFDALPEPLRPWVFSLATIALAVGVALVLHTTLFAVALRVARRTHLRGGESLVRRTRRPARLAFVLVGLQVALPALGLSEGTVVLERLVVLLLIATATWLVICAIGVLDDVLMARYDINSTDNLAARRVHTRVQVLSRTATIVVAVLGTAGALMLFPTVRQFGVSVLASAGIAGIVVGMAARPTLANLIAGLQIAFTEPIRLDDVVVMEGEWGRIEKITSTYVVLRIWDDRRLIVPLDRVIQQPFENWTRRTTQLLGTVFLYVDWSVPVDAVRAELQRIVETDARWDRRAASVLVTDTTERAVQLRALVSAGNATDLWDLRVAVREKLVAFLQREYPESLPRLRAQIAPQ